MKVAVVAGTPVDTKMGVEFLTSKGIIAVGFSVSISPEEQSKIQILSPLDLEETVRNIIEKIKYEMINTILVYCNSLSAAVDMARLSREEGIRIITPFDIYKKIAFNYNNIGVLAANNKSSAGIEKVIQSVNPNCNVIGIAILPMVVDIEKGISAGIIVGKFALSNLMEFYTIIKVDVIILGCTHFPYLYDELKKCTPIPILDPAELMYKMI